MSLDAVLRAGLDGHRVSLPEMLAQVTAAAPAAPTGRAARYRTLRHAEGRLRALVLDVAARESGFARDNLDLIVRELDSIRVRLLDAEADGEGGEP